MPIHLQSITTKDDDSELLAALLQGALDHADAAVVSDDRQYLQIAQFLNDVLSGERIGKLVFTMFRNEQEKSLRILDIDITLDSDTTTEMTFLKKLPPSSDANEYYDVEVLPGEQHLQIETVNRYLIKHEIENTTQVVKASAFPFKLDVYKSIDELNASLGFTERIIEPIDMIIGGLSETFAAPGSLFEASEDDVFSFLVGTLKHIREVEVRFDSQQIRFIIAQIETALGLLPTAMSRDVFELDNCEPGNVIAMYADIKADFAINQ